MSKCYVAVLLLLVISPFVHSGPAINVGVMNEFIPGEKNTLAKRIYNTGDSTAFVKITIDEIHYDDLSGPQERPLDTEALINGNGIGLISSPPRLIIPAGGMQTNRFLFSGPRDKERYYRVRYIPVEQNEMGPVDTSSSSPVVDEINTGVNILAGFGTVVTVGPVNSQFNTVTEEKGNVLTIKNNGNTSIFISELRSCKSAQKECSATESVQLRPGKHLTRTAENGRKWYYTLSEAGKKTTL